MPKHLNVLKEGMLIYKTNNTLRSKVCQWNENGTKLSEKSVDTMDHNNWLKRNNKHEVISIERDDISTTLNICLLLTFSSY